MAQAPGHQRTRPSANSAPKRAPAPLATSAKSLGCICMPARPGAKMDISLVAAPARRPTGPTAAAPVEVRRHVISYCALALAIVATLLAPSRHIMAGALKVSVSIPDLVKLNDAFWLNCSHQTCAGDAEPRAVGEIYAIKWYKDEEEFYRFLPNAEPRVSIYETNGIQLDVSNKSTVSERAGPMIYRCCCC